MSPLSIVRSTGATRCLQLLPSGTRKDRRREPRGGHGGSRGAGRSGRELDEPEHRRSRRMRSVRTHTRKHAIIYAFAGRILFRLRHEVTERSSAIGHRQRGSENSRPSPRNVPYVCQLAPFVAGISTLRISHDIPGNKNVETWSNAGRGCRVSLNFLRSTISLFRQRTFDFVGFANQRVRETRVAVARKMSTATRRSSTIPPRFHPRLFSQTFSGARSDETNLEVLYPVIIKTLHAMSTYVYARRPLYPTKLRWQLG